MEIAVHIGPNAYNVKIKAILFDDGMKFKSELQGTTMSTFNYRKEYMAPTIDESIKLISDELFKAWEELIGN